MLASLRFLSFQRAFLLSRIWLFRIRQPTLVAWFFSFALVLLGDLVEGAPPDPTGMRAHAGQLGNVLKGPSQNPIKGLPDWSCVWVLSDESWDDVTAAMTGHDGGRVSLTPKYTAIRAANGAANDGDGPPGGITDNSERCMPAGSPPSAYLKVPFLKCDLADR